MDTSLSASPPPLYAEYAAVLQKLLAPLANTLDMQNKFAQRMAKVDVDTLSLAETTELFKLLSRHNLSVISEFNKATLAEFLPRLESYDLFQFIKTLGPDKCRSLKQVIIDDLERAKIIEADVVTEAPPPPDPQQTLNLTTK